MRTRTLSETAALTPPRGRSATDYLLTLVLSAAAIIVRIELAPVLGASSPYLLCFAVSIYLAWSRGFWPSLVSVLIAATAGTYLIIGTNGLPPARPRVSERAAVIGFILTAVVIGWLIDFQRRTVLRANEAEGLQREAAAENAALLMESQAVRDRLAQSNRELEKANQDLEAFAYSVSHDLQEPLRTISIYTELVRLRQKDLDEENTILLSETGAAARRLATMITDILTYTKCLGSEQGPSPAVDARNIVSNVMAALDRQTRETRAVVTVGALPVVNIHESSLTQVIQNLVANALKYRAEGPPEITITAEDGAEHWTFSVQDNGIGIDSEYAERIFELFKRLHSHEEYPGTGIGLAMCRRIVEQYGGRIWLERSAKGQGSVFCFSIPKTADAKRVKLAGAA